MKEFGNEGLYNVVLSPKWHFLLFQNIPLSRALTLGAVPTDLR